MLFKTKGFIDPKGSRRDFEGGWKGCFFWVWFNVHTFNHRHLTDRRVKGWLRRDGWGVRNGWAEGEGEGKGGVKGLGMGGG
jgi:hypothetical protein